MTNPTTTTKTTTKVVRYVELIKPFTYEFYGTNVVKVGEMYRAENRNLSNNGYIIVLGHGMNEVIPWDHLKVIEETIERTVTETVTAREVPRPTFRR